MKKVVIFGAAQLAQVAHGYLSKDSPYEIAAFTVNEAYLKERTLRGLPVVPFEELEKTHPPDQFDLFVAMGYHRVNRARAEIYETCKAKGYRFISYINSRVMQWGEVEIGENCFILENSVLQPFVRIGNNVVIWSGNHIGHHAQIGDHCFIASHAVISGHVKIGDYTFVGVNATFRDGVTVAPHCVIGAAAVILKDTKEKGVYPAKSTEAALIASDELRGF